MLAPHFIFHICLPTDWDKYSSENYFEAGSLATENFIHASTAEQLAATANRYYTAEKNIVVLVIKSDLLLHELKMEWSSSVKEYFPHIYGVIDKRAIVEIMYLHRTSLAENFIF